MSGKATIIAGGTGVGKTTFLKERLKIVHKDSLHLYDVNNEYKELYPKPITSFETFAKKATKLMDAVIVYEEATIFLNNRGSNDHLRDVLVRKRHTNSTIFLVFHSLRTIPRYVFDLSNYVVVFKTNDSAKFVEGRFENELLTDCFNRVNKHPDKHYHEVFKIY